MCVPESVCENVCVYLCKRERERDRDKAILISCLLNGTLF